MFSRRVPADRRPNAFARAVAAARGGGAPLLDLTVSNPTRVGIRYGAGTLAPLGADAALGYQPSPMGLPAARAAVARDYGRRGIDFAPERVVLTASTSDAYSLLFKLLCDPGADVLSPVPSYPLFDHLTALDGLSQRPYRLEYHGRWSIDPASLDRCWTSATRAVLAVSPNNPTGSVLDEADARALADRCAARDAALILDEVFCDYPLHDGTLTQPEALRRPACLLFRLGGLSKSAGLPQVKLGWIAVDGPDALVAEALDRLELIADTYLSVSTPVQLAAPALIDAGAGTRAQMLDRVRGNYRVLAALAAGYPAVTLLHADAGWSAVLRVPATIGEEALAIELLERHGVLVHPGFFFDFPNEAFLVLSLLPEPETFARGAALVLEHAGAA